MILIYPVISFTDSIGHIGSCNNLIRTLGASTYEQIKQINYFSNEYHANKLTPHTFIAQAEDDTVVSVTNSLVFYEALKQNRIPVELHIYSSSGHGYLKNPPFEEWFGRCIYWIKSLTLIK